MALPATSVFTAADFSSPPSGSWTNQVDGMQVISNGACSTTSGYGFAYWNADAFSNDQYSQCTILLTGTGGPTVRAASTGNCYWMDTNDSGATNSFLWSRSGGSFSLLQSLGTIFLPGDVAKLTVVGTTLKCYKNGVQVGTDQTDSTFASGSAGIGALGNSGPSLDDWEGGNMGGGGGIVIPVFMNQYRQRRA